MTTVAYLDRISTYRQHLMGFSAILILACHAVGNEVVMPGVLRTILNFGNIGVDMFLFLSGMGMYYSLISHRWVVIDWYSRRYKRILIPYLVIAIPFYTFKVFVGDSGISDALYDLSTISYWTHHRSAWFIALLMPLYAVTPLLPRIIDKCKYRWIPTLLLCSACVGISIWLLDTGGEIAGNVAAALQRVPGFLVGYWMGKFIYEKTTINWGIAFLTPVLLFLSLYFLPVKIYCFWLLMFPLMQCLVLLYEHNYKGLKWFTSVSLFMGTITLESYLTNGYSSSIFKHFDWNVGGVDINYGNYVFYACVLVFGLLWAIAAHAISKKIVSR